MKNKILGTPTDELVTLHRYFCLECCEFTVTFKWSRNLTCSFCGLNNGFLFDKTIATLKENAL